MALALAMALAMAMAMARAVARARARARARDRARASSTLVGSRPSRRRMSSRSSEITKPRAARDGAAARPLGAPPAVLPPLAVALPPLAAAVLPPLAAALPPLTAAVLPPLAAALPPLAAALPPLRLAAEAGEGVAPVAAAGGTDSARVRRVGVGGWECGPSVPRVARRGGGGALLAEPPLKAWPAELLPLRAAELLSLREVEAVAGRAAAFRRVVPCAGAAARQAAGLAAAR